VLHNDVSDRVKWRLSHQIAGKIRRRSRRIYSCERKTSDVYPGRGPESTNFWPELVGFRRSRVFFDRRYLTDKRNCARPTTVPRNTKRTPCSKYDTRRHRRHGSAGFTRIFPISGTRPWTILARCFLLLSLPPPSSTPVRNLINAIRRLRFNNVSPDIAAAHARSRKFNLDFPRTPGKYRLRRYFRETNRFGRLTTTWRVVNFRRTSVRNVVVSSLMPLTDVVRSHHPPTLSRSQLDDVGNAVVLLKN